MLHPILLEIHKECKHKNNFDYHAGFFDALRCLDARIEAGEIIIEKYTLGEGIPVLETHRRMRGEGKL